MFTEMMERIRPILFKRTKYGIKIVFRGRICKVELGKQIACVKVEVEKLKKPFNIIADMRRCYPLCREAAGMLAEAKIYYMAKGLDKLVVIYRDIAQIDEFTRVARNFDENDRYLNEAALYGKKPEKIALNYILNNVEP